MAHRTRNPCLWADWSGISPMLGRIGRLVVLTLMLLPGISATAEHTSSPRVLRVVFVCEHGSVKSLVAASYFNRTAKSRGLSFDAIARGTTPESTVPRIVQKGLSEAGMNVSKFVPQMFVASDLSGAALVVSFDQDIEATVDGKVRQLKWDNLPGVLADYPRGRDAIVQKVEALIDALAKGSVQ
jgi:arsenate reductase